MKLTIHRLTSGLLLLSAACGDDGGSSQADAARDKLVQCGVISKGRFTLEEPANASEQCEAACFLKLSCTEVEAVFCDDGSGAEPSKETAACFNKCSAQADIECDGQSLPGDFVCDGEDDCEDGADETNCPAAETAQCKDGTAIPKDALCDGEKDCQDGSDEAGCPTFKCKNGELVPAGYECDLGPDCEDGSDEHDGCAKPLCG